MAINHNYEIAWALLHQRWGTSDGREVNKRKIKKQTSCLDRGRGRLCLDVILTSSYRGLPGLRVARALFSDFGCPVISHPSGCFFCCFLAQDQEIHHLQQRDRGFQVSPQIDPSNPESTLGSQFAGYDSIMNAPDYGLARALFSQSCWLLVSQPNHDIFSYFLHEEAGKQSLQFWVKDIAIKPSIGPSNRKYSSKSQ